MKCVLLQPRFGCGRTIRTHSNFGCFVCGHNEKTRRISLMKILDRHRQRVIMWSKYAWNETGFSMSFTFLLSFCQTCDKFMHFILSVGYITQHQTANQMEWEYVRRTRTTVQLPTPIMCLTVLCVLTLRV